jgi:chaperonin GroEL
MAGYNPKDIHFGSDAREKLIAGIRSMARTVKSTLGPSGNTVLMESTDHLGGVTITKDGVTVAKSLEVLDPVENLAMRVMREAAERTATEAGDGTTTSIVLTEAIIDEFETVQELSGHKLVTSEVLRYLAEWSDYLIDEIDRRAKRLSNKKLVDVASISANNDRSVGKLIAGVYKEVGRNGVVTVEMSQTNKTYYEATIGVKLDIGFASPVFINNQEKDECILRNAKVLVYDGEVSSLLQIEHILKPLVSSKQPFVLVADASTPLINTFAANVVKNGLQLCVVPPPSIGYRRHELMGDLAAAIGAKFFSSKTGDDLSLATIDDLGTVDKITVGRETTIAIPSEPESEKITKRVEELRSQLSATKKAGERKFLQRRIATLAGGIGVIYAGGSTDIEQKELYDRIDDAVCAVRAAIEDGVVAGGGVCLYTIADDIQEQGYAGKNSPEASAALSIIAYALRSPLVQIHENAGLEIVDYNRGIKGNYGIDVRTGEPGDMIQMGIVDPAKVTKEAVVNAISVAKTILSTDSILTFVRDYEASR